ncbi:hypothetical protein BMD20_12605 [Burkholderia multivorans]|nr:hypothetical protein BMD20_12605 [Burkholderia multivorans]
MQSPATSTIAGGDDVLADDFVPMLREHTDNDHASFLLVARDVSTVYLERRDQSAHYLNWLPLASGSLRRANHCLS